MGTPFEIVHTSPKMSYVGLLISATILRLEHHFRHNVRPETSALMHVVVAPLLGRNVDTVNLISSFTTVHCKKMSSF